MEVTIKQSRPYAQSLANFTFFEGYISVAIDNKENGQPTFFDTTKIGRSSETFGARFRDAVRYGIIYNYESPLFTHAQLNSLHKWMTVSIIDSPKVWVYEKSKVEPWKAAQTNKNIIESSGTTEKFTENPQVLLECKLFVEVECYLKIKKNFTPPLIIRLRYNLSNQEKETLERNYDVSITHINIGNGTNEWLLV